MISFYELFKELSIIQKMRIISFKESNKVINILVPSLPDFSSLLAIETSDNKIIYYPMKNLQECKHIISVLSEFNDLLITLSEEEQRVLLEEIPNVHISDNRIKAKQNIYPLDSIREKIVEYQYLGEVTTKYIMTETSTSLIENLKHDKLFPIPFTYEQFVKFLLFSRGHPPSNRKIDQFSNTVKKTGLDRLEDAQDLAMIADYLDFPTDQWKNIINSELILEFISIYINNQRVSWKLISDTLELLVSKMKEKNYSYLSWTKSNKRDIQNIVFDKVNRRSKVNLIEKMRYIQREINYLINNST